jgi:hypothetical protein
VRAVVRFLDFDHVKRDCQPHSRRRAFAFAEENRGIVFVKNGIIHILTAMRLFQWDETVQ